MSSFEQALVQADNWMAGQTDVIVIGAGHAGCEAALACARLGFSTILFAMNLDMVANMPCNPNIGGTAKGQLVREIDALGGEMGRLADRCMIQFRMLNASKGPAVMSPRAQIDRRAYQAAMKQTLERQPGLILRQAEVSEIYTENFQEAGQTLRRVSGVRTRAGALYCCRAVVAATGTYLQGRVIIGGFSCSSGPDNLFPATGLSQALSGLGLPLQRFKTGTPERINRRSVDFSCLERQDGDLRIVPFSYENEYAGLEILDKDRQAPCWLTYTTPETRRIVEANLHRSPLFSGDIDGIGPRYCPSIEDKFVKFPDKAKHQVFLEPMGRDTEEMYLQGMSSSLPEDVQLQMVRSLPGLSAAVISRSAYAIEYDCLDPTCLRLSLESRAVRGLFCAGQINGSSGYEEAAAQGLVAGINAARQLSGQDPLVLDRSQAYIGVLIDDLVTKGTGEPYRMMTARAEYRLVLRQDNADTRLTPAGRRVGLIGDARWELFMQKQQRIQDEISRCHKVRVAASEENNQRLGELGSSPLRGSATLAELLKRPELGYRSLAPFDPQRPVLAWPEQEAVEIQIKYEGYIRLEQDRIAQFRKTEHKELPPDIDYASISGLRLEARQKLARLRPASVGQASRISGVSPADISVLLVYLQTLPKPERKGKTE